MRYYSLVPISDKYPHNYVDIGMEKAGLTRVKDPVQAEILITWSPWKKSKRGEMADLFKRTGRCVIVMENGWLSPINNTKYFQVGLDSWNGAGRILPGDVNRFLKWKVEFSDEWVYDPNGHVVLVYQTGHKWDRMTMPLEWPGKMQKMLAKQGIPHKNRVKHDPVPLVEFLKGARALATWSSSQAAQALAYGIPVHCFGPHHILKDICSSNSKFDKPMIISREAVFSRFSSLANAQFTKDEIATGKCFKQLLKMAGY